MPTTASSNNTISTVTWSPRRRFGGSSTKRPVQFGPTQAVAGSARQGAGCGKASIIEYHGWRRSRRYQPITGGGAALQRQCPVCRDDRLCPLDCLAARTHPAATVNSLTNATNSSGLYRMARQSHVEHRRHVITTNMNTTFGQVGLGEHPPYGRRSGHNRYRK